MKFYGNGKVYKPKTKSYIIFEKGCYETSDVEEIALLEQAGCEYEGELEIKIDKKEKEIGELKSTVNELKKSADPKALKKLDERISEMAGENKTLKDKLAENERAVDILKDKAIELKFANKKEIKSWKLLDLCEQFVTRLQPAKESKK